MQDNNELDVFKFIHDEIKRAEHRGDSRASVNLKLLEDKVSEVFEDLDKLNKRCLFAEQQWHLYEHAYKELKEGSFKVEEAFRHCLKVLRKYDDEHNYCDGRAVLERYEALLTKTKSPSISGEASNEEGGL